MKEQSFNIRVIKRVDGIFTFDDKCFMHRCAKRGKNSEWVDASRTDRNYLKLQLQMGG